MPPETDALQEYYFKPGDELVYDGTSDSKKFKYRIKRGLGKGGCGEVYLAIDNNHNKEVALKIVLQHRKLEDKFKNMYWEELRIAKSIRSKYTVTIMNIEIHDECPILIMEYICGKTLADYIKGLHSARERMEFFEQTAEQINQGVNDIHEADIIHRDLKPGNIMVVNEEQGIRIKIMDFGMAVPFNHVQDNQNFEGTFAYAAPERISNSSIDSVKNRKSDLWSLGVIFYEMLVGVRPFDSTNLGHLATKILKAEYEDPSKKLEIGRSNYITLIKRLLVIEPERRISYSEIHKLLERPREVDQLSSDSCYNIYRSIVLSYQPPMATSESSKIVNSRFSPTFKAINDESNESISIEDLLKISETNPVLISGDVASGKTSCLLKIFRDYRVDPGNPIYPIYLPLRSLYHIGSNDSIAGWDGNLRYILEKMAKCHLCDNSSYLDNLTQLIAAHKCLFLIDDLGDPPIADISYDVISRALNSVLMVSFEETLADGSEGSRRNRLIMASRKERHPYFSSNISDIRAFRIEPLDEYLILDEISQHLDEESAYILVHLIRDQQGLFELAKKPCFLHIIIEVYLENLKKKDCIQAVCRVQIIQRVLEFLMKIWPKSRPLKLQSDEKSASAGFEIMTRLATMNEDGCFEFGISAWEKETSDHLVNPKHQDIIEDLVNMGLIIPGKSCIQFTLDDVCRLLKTKSALQVIRKQPEMHLDLLPFISEYLDSAELLEILNANLDDRPQISSLVIVNNMLIVDEHTIDKLCARDSRTVWQTRWKIRQFIENDLMDVIIPKHSDLDAVRTLTLPVLRDGYILAQVYELLKGWLDTLNSDGQNYLKSKLLDELIDRTSCMVRRIEFRFELPLERVCIRTGKHSSAYIGKYPVRNSEYTPFDSNHRRRWGLQDQSLDKMPVTHVTWLEAQLFSIWAGGRLPTVKEWRIACYGREKNRRLPRKYAWGDDFEMKRLNSLESDQMKPTSADAFPLGATPIDEQGFGGVFDMNGNTWEWCESDKGVSNLHQQKPSCGGSFLCTEQVIGKEPMILGFIKGFCERGNTQSFRVFFMGLLEQ